jgi:hypothetical protein
VAVVGTPATGGDGKRVMLPTLRSGAVMFTLTLALLLLSFDSATWAFTSATNCSVCCPAVGVQS